MKNKEIWSVDCMIDAFNCSEGSFDQVKLKSFAQKISKIIDPGPEILGIVNPFGDHEKRMKGIRMIHENQNSLITGHFVYEGMKLFLHITSCSAYKVSEVIEVIKEKFGDRRFFMQESFKRICRGRQGSRIGAKKKTSIKS